MSIPMGWNGLDYWGFYMLVVSHALGERLDTGIVRGVEMMAIGVKSMAVVCQMR